MAAYIVFLICVIFTAPAICYETASNPNAKDRSVNIALETVLEFNNKENSADLKLLDSMKKLIGKVKTVINQHTSPRTYYNPYLGAFAGFIQCVLEILEMYTDNELQNFVTVFSQEIRNYHYKGCKFNELIGDNDDLRRAIARELDVLKSMPVSTIRDRMLTLSHMIDQDQYYPESIKPLVDYLNDIYKDNCNEKFERFLIKIYDYHEKSNKSYENLVEILREGIKSIIFDYYTQLNSNKRLTLKSKIDKFWHPVLNFRSYDVKSPVRKNNHNKKHRLHNDPVKPKSERTEFTSKTTKEPKFRSQSLEENPVNSRNNPHTNEDSTSEIKKLTFLTLYPKFGPDWTTANFQFGRNQFKHHEHELPTMNDQEKHIKLGEISRVRAQDTDLEQTSGSQENKYTTSRTKEQTLRIIHNSNAHVKLTTKGRNKMSKRPKLTFMTLYPEFIIEGTWQTPQKTNKQWISKTHSTPKRSYQTLWYEPIQKSETNETRESRKLHVSKAPYRPGEKNMKSLIPGVHSKMHKMYHIEQKLSSKNHEIKPKLSEPHVGPFGNYVFEPNNNKRLELSSHHTERTFRRSFKVNNIYPNKSSLEKRPREIKRRDSDEKRVNNIPDDSVADRETVLARIKQLENELSDVKTQMNNDTEIIKDLNTKIQKEQDTLWLRDRDVERTNKRQTYSYQSVTKNYKMQSKKQRDVFIDLAENINGRKQKDMKYEGFKKYNTYSKDKGHQYNHQPNNKRIAVERKHNYESNTFNRDKNKYYEGHQFEKYNERNIITTEIGRLKFDAGELEREQEIEYHSNVQRNTKYVHFMSTKGAVYDFTANKNKYKIDKVNNNDRDMPKRGESSLASTSIDANFNKDLARKYLNAWIMKKYKNRTNIENKNSARDTYKKDKNRSSFVDLRHQNTNKDKKNINERYESDVSEKYMRSKDSKKYVHNSNINNMPRISDIKTYTKDGSNKHNTVQQSYTRDNSIKQNLDPNKNTDIFNGGSYSEGEMKRNINDEEYLHEQQSVRYKPPNINHMKTNTEERHYAFDKEKMNSEHKFVIHKPNEREINKEMKGNYELDKGDLARYNENMYHSTNNENIDHDAVRGEHISKVNTSEGFRARERNINENVSQHDTDEKYAQNANINENNFSFKSDMNKDGFHNSMELHDLDINKDKYEGGKRQQVYGAFEQGMSDNIAPYQDHNQTNLYETKFDKDFVDESLKNISSQDTLTSNNNKTENTYPHILNTSKLLNYKEDTTTQDILKTEKPLQIKNENTELKIEKENTTFYDIEDSLKESSTSKVKNATLSLTTLEEKYVTSPSPHSESLPDLPSGARRMLNDETHNSDLAKNIDTKEISEPTTLSLYDGPENDNPLNPVNNSIHAQIDTNTEDSLREVTVLDQAEEVYKDTQQPNEETNDIKLTAEDIDLNEVNANEMFASNPQR